MKDNFKSTIVQGDEINLLDGVSAGNIKNSTAVIYGSNGEVNVKTLKIDSVSVNVGADKLNHLGTVQSDIQVQIDAKLNTEFTCSVAFI